MKSIDLEKLQLYDTLMKSYIAKRTYVRITLEEYENRLALYNSDNSYIDPDSGLPFKETVYFTTNENGEETPIRAIDIVYTDNFKIGAINVQNALDLIASELNSKADSILYDKENSNLQLKNGDTILSTTTIESAEIDFVGTTLEVEEAIANGTITEGTKVYITDDYSVENYSTNLLSDLWVGDTIPYIYDLGIEDRYDFEVTLPSYITEEQIDALQFARIIASGDDNLLRAWGEKPTIDIPVIVKIWMVD